eukprot:1399357-Lingulodinium_polyedra.AAC.1
MALRRLRAGAPDVGFGGCGTSGFALSVLLLPFPRATPGALPLPRPRPLLFPCLLFPFPVPLP